MNATDIDEDDSIRYRILHVSNGAALALIVKDPPNTLPEIVATAEEVLMLMHLTPSNGCAFSSEVLRWDGMNGTTMEEQSR